MAVENDLALLEMVRALAADLEVGGEREWARLLREALAAGVVSNVGKEEVRSVLRNLRAAEAASRPGRRERIWSALGYLDQVLGQEPQY
jgi:hypothetical protein